VHNLTAREIQEESVLKPSPKRKDVHQRQLSDLKRQVDVLRDQLRRAQQLATMGTMTAMVAHEFNNILTPIINYAQLASVNPSFAPKAVAKAADGGKRAAQICQAILGLTSNTPDEPTSEDLREIVAQTISAMAREPAKDAINLIVDIPDNLEIITRRVELQQVILNLIMNARHAVMQTHGTRSISIRARQQGDETVIQVEDNGNGIPKANLRKIFEPFFSTKKDATEGGSGLGLAICRQIVRGLGGKIDVESTLNESTTFTIHLPRGNAGIARIPSIPTQRLVPQALEVG